jgi:DNA-binding NarL/FixJ family response regulator
MPRAKIIRVLVVDDNRKVRQGLRMRLEHAGNIWVGEAASGEEAVRRARTDRPDVIIMDLHMPRMDGLEAMCLILEAATQKRPKVLMLTSDVSDRFVVSAMEAGASGYLLKNHETDNLVDIIRRTLDGESTVSPRLTPRLLRELSELRQEQPDWAAIASLSAAERRVTALLASGKTTNEEIAAALSLSPYTVRSQITSAIRRLGLSDRTQLALWGARNRLDTAGP